MEGWAAAGSQPILCCPCTPSPGQCGSPCHPGLGVLGGHSPGVPMHPLPHLAPCQPIRTQAVSNR